VHWTELQDRNRLDAAVQESLLAVPYALGKLGAYQRSLEKYEEAIGVYTREMNRLDVSIAAIRAGKLTRCFCRKIRSKRWAGSGSLNGCRMCRRVITWTAAIRA